MYVPAADLAAAGEIWVVERHHTVQRRHEVGEHAWLRGMPRQPQRTTVEHRERRRQRQSLASAFVVERHQRRKRGHQRVPAPTAARNSARTEASLA